MLRDHGRGSADRPCLELVRPDALTLELHVAQVGVAGRGKHARVRRKDVDLSTREGRQLAALRIQDQKADPRAVPDVWADEDSRARPPPYVKTDSVVSGGGHLQKGADRARGEVDDQDFIGLEIRVPHAEGCLRAIGAERAPLDPTSRAHREGANRAGVKVERREPRRVGGRDQRDSLVGVEHIHGLVREQKPVRGRPCETVSRWMVRFPLRSTMESTSIGEAGEGDALGEDEATGGGEDDVTAIGLPPVGPHASSAIPTAQNRARFIASIVSTVRPQKRYSWHLPRLEGGLPAPRRPGVALGCAAI